jgi:peptide deformylase
MVIEVIPNEQTPRVPEIQMNENCLERIAKVVEKQKAFKDYAYSRFDAAGLAANQVSIDGERFMSRVFALRNKDNTVRLIIEPQITEYIGIKELKVEGCLTWKGKVVVAERSRAVRVSYYNEAGEKIENEIYKGFDAQVWQHEINHLNGIQEQIEEIGFAVPKPIEVGRNEKCPCGSGKKYKQCCLI